jgi:hypothetical protein
MQEVWVEELIDISMLLLDCSGAMVRGVGVLEKKLESL